jgi:hypothetical protein
MKTIPTIGDRVERRTAGITQCGTVHYADQLQVLVKWDNGSSSSLRTDIDELRVIKQSRPVPHEQRMGGTSGNSGEVGAILAAVGSEVWANSSNSYQTSAGG